MGEWPTRVTESGVVVVRPAGRLNAITAPDLRNQLRALVEAGSARVVVDFSAVSELDSSALGALISGLKVARQAGGDLRVAAPNEHVRLVFHLAKLDGFLNICQTTEGCFDEPT